MLQQYSCTVYKKNRRKDKKYVRIMKKLFIIGNGFDREHNLSTAYNPHFKEIAERNEQISYFWDIYQSREVDIWADFENCLAHPDFNSLEKIFDGYAPDYSSDYERDRNAIITQVDLNGKLLDALYVFADRAEREIDYVSPESKYVGYFSQNDLFVTCNYTHTLEKIYNICSSKVLHIHGEVGKDNLILGYPKGNYEAEKYYYDVRQKGRGPYRVVNIEEHVKCMLEEELMDYYTYTAYISLIEKTKSFYKSPQIKELDAFLKDLSVEEIIVIGHSCAIDLPYFKYLNDNFPLARWMFNPFDEDTKTNIEKMIDLIGIKLYTIQ